MIKKIQKLKSHNILKILMLYNLSISRSLLSSFENNIEQDGVNVEKEELGKGRKE